MLLDRPRPVEDQGFGDYLSELAYSNGFKDVGAFKQFLETSSVRKYGIFGTYGRLLRIITGLFVELGIDGIPSGEGPRPLCFRCLNMIPANWNWSVITDAQCQDKLSFPMQIGMVPGSFQGNRANYCGLMMCSVKKLGLNYSPSKEGLFYADILSREERAERQAPRIYPAYLAFVEVKKFTH